MRSRVSLWLTASLVLLGLAVSAGRAMGQESAHATLTVNATDKVVEWDTGDGEAGQLFVSVDNAPEDFVGEAAQGSNDISWLSSSKRYEFTLYAGRSHDRQLAAATVEPTTGPDPPIVPVLPKIVDRLLGLHVVPLALIALALASTGRIARAVVVAAVIWALVPVLTSLPAPLATQPFPDAAEYADAAYQMVHGNGYVTVVHGHGPEPPRYPPGFSLALTPFAALGDYPTNVALGARAFAVLYVVLTAAAAWKLGGPNAGAVTTVFIGSSPFALVSSRLVLSDGLAAALTVPLILLVHSASPRRSAVAGALGAALMTIRLSAGVALPALLLAVPARARWAVLAGAAPLLLALGLFQWHTFGSPFRTGYDYWPPGVSNFSLTYATVRAPFGDGPWIVPDRLNGVLMRWLCPCVDGGPQATGSDVQIYPALLLGLFWVFTPPLVTLVGFAYLWYRRREVGARFAIAQIALSLVFYCVYYYQGSRFMAAPATIIAIYSGVGIGYWSRQPRAQLVAFIQPVWRRFRYSRSPTSRATTPQTQAPKMASSRRRS